MNKKKKKNKGGGVGFLFVVVTLRDSERERETRDSDRTSFTDAIDNKQIPIPNNRGRPACFGTSTVPDVDCDNTNTNIN